MENNFISKFLKLFTKHNKIVHFSDDEVSFIQNKIKYITYKSQEFIYKENESHTSVLFILKGDIDLLKKNAISGKNDFINRRTKGEVIGEGLFFKQNKSHSTSCIAVNNVQLLEINKDDLNKILEHKTLSQKFSHMIARYSFEKLQTTECAGKKFKAMPHPLFEDKTINIPIDAYYQTNTALACENFQITGIPMSHFSNFIDSFAIIKKAAALTHKEIGEMDEIIADAIIETCDEIINSGKNSYLRKQFIVDMIQGGAGTSSNMNANEVISTRANEILVSKYGKNAKKVSSHDHVNKSQSTNDSYPSAIHIAIELTYRKCTKALGKLADSFYEKEEEFKSILKMGRTQLQDAVPMTLGQEFGAYADAVTSSIKYIERVIENVNEINLGATAIGTGVNASKAYSNNIINNINKVLEQRGEKFTPFRQNKNLILGTWDTSPFVRVSSALKSTAIKLSKISSDLRLLSSGPIGGFKDINLPPMQPGSSIMPGKVNPVIPEVVNQVCFQIIGNDTTISLASESGQLQLNAFEPVIAFNLFQSMDMLANATKVLAKHIKGIEANEDYLLDLVHKSPTIATFLNETIGYDEAVKVAREILKSKRSAKDIILEKKLMNQEQYNKMMSIDNLTKSNV